MTELFRGGGGRARAAVKCSAGDIAAVGHGFCKGGIKYVTISIIDSNLILHCEEVAGTTIQLFIIPVAKI